MGHVDCLYRASPATFCRRRRASPRIVMRITRPSTQRAVTRSNDTLAATSQTLPSPTTCLPPRRTSGPAGSFGPRAFPSVLSPRLRVTVRQETRVRVRPRPSAPSPSSTDPDSALTSDRGPDGARTRYERRETEHHPTSNSTRYLNQLWVKGVLVPSQSPLSALTLPRPSSSSVTIMPGPRAPAPPRTVITLPQPHPHSSISTPRTWASASLSSLSSSRIRSRPSIVLSTEQR